MWDDDTRCESCGHPAEMGCPCSCCWPVEVQNARRVYELARESFKEADEELRGLVAECQRKLAAASRKFDEQRDVVRDAKKQLADLTSLQFMTIIR
jgi:hypothetical protein